MQNQNQYIYTSKLGVFFIYIFKLLNCKIVPFLKILLIHVTEIHSFVSFIVWFMCVICDFKKDLQLFLFISQLL